MGRYKALPIHLKSSEEPSIGFQHKQAPESSPTFRSQEHISVMVDRVVLDSHFQNARLSPPYLAYLMQSPMHSPVIWRSEVFPAAFCGSELVCLLFVALERVEDWDVLCTCRLTTRRKSGLNHKRGYMGESSLIASGVTMLLNARCAN